MKIHLAITIVAALTLGSCTSDTTEPTVTFDDGTCSSSDVSNWPKGAPDILLTNNTDVLTALIVGTYNDGFGRADLLDYGSDISIRPPFITALEIIESAPRSTSNARLDLGAGTYFMVCMPTTNTMVVLDDLSIDR